MTACTFCIDSIVRGYSEYQPIQDIPLADKGLSCERKMGNSHDPQAMVLKKVIDGIPVGHVPKKYLSINLFDIHYSRETLPQMCKNLDGENLANFWSVVNFVKFQQRQSFAPYCTTSTYIAHQYKDLNFPVFTVHTYISTHVYNYTHVNTML